MTTPERHPYTRTPKGRWECASCGVGIRNEDCPHNRALDDAALSHAEKLANTVRDALRESPEITSVVDPDRIYIGNPPGDLSD